jgi:hypothetical protein
VNDQEFVDAFFSGTLPNEQFHHRDHLRLTWLMLGEHGRELGARKVSDGLRDFTAAHEHSFRYHETMTQFWIWLVDHVRTARPQIKSFEEFISAFPAALDKGLPFRHWSPEVMMSSAARAGWVGPDLVPLP